MVAIDSHIWHTRKTFILQPWGWKLVVIGLYVSKSGNEISRNTSCKSLGDYQGYPLKDFKWGMYRGSVTDLDEKKFFLTVAWPYPSGPMHVGHARTYLIPDIVARWKRMMGYDVLFPMGFHLTGTPIVGSVKRIKRGDRHYIKLLREVYGVSEEDLKSGRLEDAEQFARYFIEESPLGYKSGMNGLSLSIDWSRECTSIDPQFKRMVEWQFNKLHKMDLVRRGKHPVKYCPSDDNPVTDHDLLEGEGVSIVEFTLIKYRGEDGAIYPSATLRPETVFGVTNLWVNPDIHYLKARVGDEDWIISEECAEKLPFQGKSVTISGKVAGEYLIGKSVTNPVTGDEIEILPAKFVDPGNGTGVVNSVPAHAPFDYIALKDLGSDLAPKEVIQVPGHGNVTEEMIGELGIKNQHSKKLEEATKTVYNLEFTTGVMVNSIPGWGGKSVKIAKDAIKSELLKNSRADLMWEFDEKPVQCRCGAECVVKVVEDQWFLRYSDERWKEKVRKYLDQMEFVPRESKEYFKNVLAWLEDWPCTRKVGMGTKLPWDDKWIIESLSDSTIYMAYYTIAPYVKEMDPTALDGEVYDYILLGKGDLDKLAEKGLDVGLLKRARESFTYWYPLDVRYSANDLIPNHLTFMLYHHLALFPKELAPQGIVTFGMGVLEGGKMSSSKGNIYPLSKAVDELGSDGARYYLSSLSEPWQDFNFRRGQALTASRITERIREIVRSTRGGKKREKPEWLDRWLRSVFQKDVEETNRTLAKYQIRKGLLAAVDGPMRNIRWYLRRGGDDIGVILEDWIKLMNPFLPNLAQDLWEFIGNGGDVEKEPYPQLDSSFLDEDANSREKFIQDVMEDIGKIVVIALRKKEKKEKKIRVVVAKGDMGVWECKTLRSSIPLLEERFGMAVEVGEGLKERKEPLPGRPAIYIEDL